MNYTTFLLNIEYWKARVKIAACHEVLSAIIPNCWISGYWLDAMTSSSGSQQLWISTTDDMSCSRRPYRTGCRNVCINTHYPTSFDLSLSLPNVDTISQFVTLITATSAPIFPPVAILGTTYVFVQWLSTAVLEEVYVPLSILRFYSYWWWTGPRSNVSWSLTLWISFEYWEDCSPKLPALSWLPG